MLVEVPSQCASTPPPPCSVGVPSSYPATRGRLAAATRRRGGRGSLVWQEELPASAARPLRGDLLEFRVRCESGTYDVTARLIPHETLVRAHLVAYLVVIHHL